MTTEITRLLTRTGAAGDRVEFTLTLDGGEVRGTRFTGHYGTVRGGGLTDVDCLYKVARWDRGRRAVENEIAVLSGLGWAGVNDGRFAELIGYDLDPAEGGAVLVQRRRGRAAAQRLATTMPTEDELWQPTHDLLSALQILAHHNYVHGAISSTTVFWDGEGLQIADLSMATTQTDAEDGAVRDVRHAAGLLYWLASGDDSAFGYQADGAGSAEQEYRWLKAHRPCLAMVLRPVYEGESPTAEELLAAMVGWPRPVRPRRPVPPRGPEPKKDREPTRADDTETQHHIGATPEDDAHTHQDAKTSRDAKTSQDTRTHQDTRKRTDTGSTRRLGDDPSEPPDDREDRQFRKYLVEKVTNMHGQPEQPVGAAVPGSGPAPSRRPRPEPGSLPPDFPFRVGEDGGRRPHPLVWVAVGALVAVILLLVVFS